MFLTETLHMNTLYTELMDIKKPNFFKSHDAAVG